jgi:hypothetical protein
MRLGVGAEEVDVANSRGGGARRGKGEKGNGKAEAGFHGGMARGRGARRPGLGGSMQELGRKQSMFPVAIPMGHSGLTRGGPLPPKPNLQRRRAARTALLAKLLEAALYRLSRFPE